MREILSSDEMRALEKRAIESGAVTGLILMERAGEEVVASIFERWPDLPAAGRAVVLCGPGNNGGDGYVVARLLRTRGWDVQVFFYGKVTGLPADACRNCDRWHQMGGETEHLGFPQVSSKDAERFKMAAYKDPVADLVIDAAFGIGLTRPLEGLRPIIALNNHFCGPAAVARAGYHVSIDLPSGLAESGPLSDTLASVFYADLTVTFHRQKKAHGQGRAFCGQIDVRDIGL